MTSSMKPWERKKGASPYKYRSQAEELRTLLVVMDFLITRALNSLHGLSPIVIGKGP